MRNGATLRVPIQTGISDGVNIQVLAGLQPGDQVITGSSTGSSNKQASSSALGTGSIFGFGGPGPGPGGGGNNNRPGGQGQGGQGGARPGG